MLLAATVAITGMCIVLASSYIVPDCCITEGNYLTMLWVSVVGSNISLPPAGNPVGIVASVRYVNCYRSWKYNGIFPHC